jgi:hypothetical protein
MITTQNSYTYLQAVLGTRAPELYGNVADPTLVDAGYSRGNVPVLSVGSSVSGSFNRLGDYHVFELHAATAQPLYLNVLTPPGSSWQPLVMVYNEDYSNPSAGPKLLAVYDPKSANALFKPQAGTNYKIVVGAFNGMSIGNYSLWITRNALDASGGGSGGGWVGPIPKGPHITATPGVGSTGLHGAQQAALLAEAALATAHASASYGQHHGVLAEVPAGKGPAGPATALMATVTTPRTHQRAPLSSRHVQEAAWSGDWQPETLGDLFASV